MILSFGHSLFFKSGTIPMFDQSLSVYGLVYCNIDYLSRTYIMKHTNFSNHTILQLPIMT